MVLPVLPLLALSGYVTIDGVTAENADGKINVAVTTSAAVGETDVRAKLTGGVLQLYLNEGHVNEHHRSFKSGGLAITVFKRTNYAKVEVPLAEDLGCAGPVSVEAAETGFSAAVACKNAAPANEEPNPFADKAAVAAKPSTNTDTSTNTKAGTPSNTNPPTNTKTDSPPNTATPSAVTLAQAAPSHGGNFMMVPLMLLVAAGGAAFYFKKRQHKQTSMIQILETAQLGPKRQLVVAKVNGETMVLGSSEAGISCLTGQFRVPGEGTLASFPNLNALATMQPAAAPAVVMPTAPAPQQFVPFDPPPPPKSSGNEFVDEGGLLTKLFRARGQDKPTEKVVEKFENIELHEFDNLLQESIADQELRRKLSSGLSGKVS